MLKKLVLSSVLLFSLSGAAFAASIPTLTSAQKAELFYMYQEEKVARDVYLTFAKQYPSQKTFSNIALSEQSHADAVEKLCIKYKIDISKVNESSVGNFVLPELQALHDTLVIQGGTSLVFALNIGVAIEEKDIKDLEAAKAGMPADVVKVFNNLKNGSINHLSAFKNALLQR